MGRPERRRDEEERPRPGPLITRVLLARLRAELRDKELDALEEARALRAYYRELDREFREARAEERRIMREELRAELRASMAAEAAEVRASRRSRVGLDFDGPE